MDKVAISLEPGEVQELQRILLDEDAAAALEYLRDCVAPKVAVYTGAKHCRPVFEFGAAEPSLLKDLKRKADSNE